MVLFFAVKVFFLKSHFLSLILILVLNIQTGVYCCQLYSKECIEINIEYSGGKRTIPATINCEEYSKYERSTEKIYKSKVEIPSFEGESISVTYSASKITNEVKRKYES